MLCDNFVCHLKIVCSTINTQNTLFLTTVYNVLPIRLHFVRCYTKRLGVFGKSRQPFLCKANFHINFIQKTLIFEIYPEIYLILECEWRFFDKRESSFQVLKFWFTLRQGRDPQQSIGPHPRAPVKQKKYPWMF